MNSWYKQERSWLEMQNVRLYPGPTPSKSTFEEHQVILKLVSEVHCSEVSADPSLHKCLLDFCQARGWEGQSSRTLTLISSAVTSQSLLNKSHTLMSLALGQLGPLVLLLLFCLPVRPRTKKDHISLSHFLEIDWVYCIDSPWPKSPLTSSCEVSHIDWSFLKLSQIFLILEKQTNKPLEFL